MFVIFFDNIFVFFILIFLILFKELSLNYWDGSIINFICLIILTSTISILITILILILIVIQILILKFIIDLFLIYKIDFFYIHKFIFFIYFLLNLFIRFKNSNKNFKFSNLLQPKFLGSLFSSLLGSNDGIIDSNDDIIDSNDDNNDSNDEFFDANDKFATLNDFIKDINDSIRKFNEKHNYSPKDLNDIINNDNDIINNDNDIINNDNDIINNDNNVINNDNNVINNDNDIINNDNDIINNDNDCINHENDNINKTNEICLNYEGLLPDYIKNGDDLKKIIDSPQYWREYFNLCFNDKDLESDEKAEIYVEFTKFKAAMFQSDSKEFYEEMLKLLHAEKHNYKFIGDPKTSVFWKEVDKSNLPYIYTDLKVLRGPEEIGEYFSTPDVSNNSWSVYTPKSDELADNADNFPAGWDAFDLYKFMKKSRGNL